MRAELRDLALRAGGDATTEIRFLLMDPPPEN